MKVWVFFFLSFFIEVHVKAGSLHGLGLAKNIAQLPQNCLEKKLFPCAVTTMVNEKIKMKKWVLGEKSTLILHSTQKFELVSGYLWVKAKQKVEVMSPFGSYFGVSGEYWVLRKEKYDVVRNISAALEIKGKDRKAYELPMGFEIDIYPYNPFKSYSEIELPRALNINDHIHLWGKLYSGDKSQFYVEVKYLKPIWRNAVEQSTKLYQQISDRGLASYKEKQRKYRVWKKSYDKETEKILEEFRKKNYFQ